MWEVEYTDEFWEWWKSLNLWEQAAVYETVSLLEQKGPHLSFPYSSGIQNSRHGAMRELRTQCQGRPLRTLYVFDPRRVALLLIGGDKTGNDRWYDVCVPLADKIYDQYLVELRSGKPEEEL
ncbi:MAG: type II toxin-antitoxin system RelE/ParE family toxin [Spirochaetaceae bacterium]|jgi:hypothetical protein|nr:type II toxin-antitoxin system RelE/ParE family toxin [Spirochaetaceae bacterium]